MSTFTVRRLAWKSVLYHRRTAVQVALGTAVASAVLTGALIVGDSVRYSLTRFALLRLGKVDAAMPLVHRFAEANLADGLREATGTDVTAVLRLPGMALVDAPQGVDRQVNRVAVLGVSTSFWRFAEGGAIPLEGQQAAIGARLANALGVKEGDTIGIRIAKPSLLPRQAPLASRKDKLALRSNVTVVRVLPDESMGRFSLDANQVAPFNVFVALDWLQERVDMPGKANLFLAGGGGHEPRKQGAVEALSAVWTPAHAGLAWKESGRLAQLESDRIYIDPAVVAAVPKPNVPTLTYLVSSIAASDGARRVPYSFAVACGAAEDPELSPVPPGMADDEALINSWVSSRLGVTTGDTIVVEYQELLDSDRFAQRKREFRVRGVVPIESLGREAKLVPKFPGLTDVNSCREWDIGMPMDEAALRDKDNEEYWRRYHATPKVFLTLAAGRAMWGNRFGDTSAVRIPAGPGALSDARKALRENLDPAMLGFVFVPVRQQAMRAVEQGMDFGELFLGMSFFLIVAALLLTGMLFAFGVEQRGEEIGILAAQGFRTRDLRRIAMAEGLVLSVLGSVAGAFIASLYTRGLIFGLGRYWSDAVAGAAIHYQAATGTFVAGAVASVICAMVTLLVAAWRQTRRPARELLELDATQSSSCVGRRGPGWVVWVLSLGGGGVALGLAAWGALVKPDGAVEVFFSAGGLLLVSGLAAVRLALHAMDSGSAHAPSVAGMGMRNAARRMGRSISVAALLACGTFLVLAVSSMKQDVAATAHRRDSGAGGFALFAESSFDVPEDLNTVKGRRMLIPNPDKWPAGMEAVPIKVRDGDDASCFNLNRAQSPRILGVNPREFTRRRAFCSASDAGIWGRLDAPQPDGAVPALIGDDNTAKYGLNRKVGDVLAFNDERGGQFRVRVAGVLPYHITVFQGTILVPVGAFNEKFPSSGGFRIALLDVPRTTGDAERLSVVQRLTVAGLDVTGTADRVQMFYSVEETYLQMFLVLGGLGLLLGSIGLGVMVLRNVLERRGELAMLLCLGFTRREVASMVVAEHAMLLVAGIVIGVMASSVAMWPSLNAPGVTVPIGLLATLLLAMLAVGIGWTIGAARLALRGHLLNAVRNE
jgi:ABC-type lipoprotein release transport system permease subunit